jgi:excisionase family DNA binding protein
MTQDGVEVEHLSPDVLEDSGEFAYVIGPDGQRVELSRQLYELLERLVCQVREGGAVQVITYHRDLTTQQAAEILGVSRQYLVRLLEQGDLPFTKTGTHRRLRLEDVLAYRRRRGDQRRAALDRLARASQEMGDY